MSDLLNEIISVGGTTAHQNPVSADTLQEWYAKFEGQSSWQIALDSNGQIMGFQFAEPHANLPDDALDISSFVRVGAVKMGIGSKLFDATKKAVERLGFNWLNATIRGDNTGGLAYYTSRGFQTWTTDENVPLPDGTIVTKISKRFDLNQT
ncbi:MAG: GNAT family N-acetyltransferase [Marinosulfonomonas sp.]|nr:GNAT family N-acetyltransferase [Marinosulfonomonas sp.]